MGGVLNGRFDFVYALNVLKELHKLLETSVGSLNVL